jgi:hypothetical protein
MKSENAPPTKADDLVPTSPETNTMTTGKPNETPLPTPPEPRNEAERNILAAWERSRGAEWVLKHGNRILHEARVLGEV